jgi:hypothetical protein
MIVYVEVIPTSFILSWIGLNSIFLCPLINNKCYTILNGGARDSTSFQAWLRFLHGDALRGE